MGRYVVTSEARRDLEGLHAYIAKDSAAAALRVLRQLRDAMRMLGDHPDAGAVRADLTDEPVRFKAVGSYHVIYNPAPRPIEVVRVLHVRRDVGAALSELHP